MKDGVIADYRVTEAMLRYFIDKALGKWNMFKPEVMVSVPAGVTSTERRAVIEAAIKAGDAMADLLGPSFAVRKWNKVKDYNYVNREIDSLKKIGDEMASHLSGSIGSYPKALAKEWNECKSGFINKE
jgi:hypothetical protein